jgi:hypothetical protein
VRRRIDRDGVSAQLAADVNIAVNTGGGSARQSVVVRQNRTAAAAPDEQVSSNPEEQT